MNFLNFLNAFESLLGAPLLVTKMSQNPFLGENGNFSQHLLTTALDIIHSQRFFGQSMFTVSRKIVSDIVNVFFLGDQAEISITNARHSLKN